MSQAFAAFNAGSSSIKFSVFLAEHVWSSPASSPGLAGAPTTRILELVDGGEA